MSDDHLDTAAAARLEAKLDIALAQQGAQISMHGRDIQELRADVRDIDTRTTANALTIADVRAQVRAGNEARHAFPTWLSVLIAFAGVVVAIVAVATR